MKSALYTISALTTLLSISLIVGCGDKTTKQPVAHPAGSDPGHPHKEKENHEAHGAHKGHGAGPHDGTLADWGGGKYHVEFTVDHDKKEATVFVLGSDEKSPQPITAKSLLLTIKKPQLQANLMPEPMDGETDGMSSRFVGTHDGLATVMEYEGTISAEFDGTPYAGNFKEEAHVE